MIRQLQLSSNNKIWFRYLIPKRLSLVTRPESYNLSLVNLGLGMDLDVKEFS